MVRERVTPLLANNSNVVDWLFEQTEPISKQNQCEHEKPTTEDAATTTEATSVPLIL